MFQSIHEELIMNRKNAWLAAVAAALCLVSAARTSAQQRTIKHHHYKLFDMGTLGGPSSVFSGPNGKVINNHGTFVAYANTATPNPNANCAIPFNANGGGGDCFVEHPVLWHNGTLTDLELLPGGANGQTGWISDSGLVTGFSENGLLDPLTGLPIGRPALWTKRGKIIDIGALPGGSQGLATAVNNRGQVVGFSDNGILDAFSMTGLPTQSRAFLWQDGAIRDLGTLGGSDAIAFYINDRGQVAGSSYTNAIPSPGCNGSPTTDPFFWENGKMLDIGTFGGTCGGPGWMNNRGQVVGGSNYAGDQTSSAFLWDKEHGLKDLGLLPGGLFGGANWINDEGEIVGGSDGGTFFHAVLWKEGAILDLGTIYGEACTDAYSINSKGQVVGFASADCNYEDHAFLWEHGSMVDLNALVSPASSLTVRLSYDINDSGEISGSAPFPNGDEHAVALIPCDENHPHLDGCDYALVDAPAATQLAPAKSNLSLAPAASSAINLSPADLATRARSLMARHMRGIAPAPTSPR
jgi:probable HAF family extracellular repeat protein